MAERHHERGVECVEPVKTLHAVLLAEVVAFNLVVFTEEIDALAVVVCERLVDNFTVVFLTEELDDLAVAVCVGAVDKFNVLFVT